MNALEIKIDDKYERFNVIFSTNLTRILMRTCAKNRATSVQINFNDKCPSSFKRYNEILRPTIPCVTSFVRFISYPIPN